MIVTPLVASFTSAMLGISMFVVSLFLILLILVQRGRGGGLTGALGGPGGQSAFGTKAGDLFTRITSFVALGWITLCAFTMWSLGPDMAVKDLSSGPVVTASPADGKDAIKDFINLGGDTKGDDTKNGVELAPATDGATKAEMTTPASADVVAPADAAAPVVPATTEPATTTEPAAPTTESPATVEPAAPTAEPAAATEAKPE